MKYYRANREAYDYFNKTTLVKGELCTVSQRNKMFPHIPDEYFDTVTVKKTETYFFFGVRFPYENADVIVHKKFACL